ncbi:T9SS type A sorting domain-containing protein [Adhaeribacter radiodurans]|uniref:T9SS type A sorting domain-containing protein n=1 Tax=Adhaeribacter radiodurans TaxID=2745197 RepID=A0A7L7L8I9_9BACT|nr:T9SS type A sorting domain-containing protein [Adhaeribacter radiodurans]QMU29146.1 T9SS type A sorting domain-containing protein [Adhaeribacter radiodurans]
MKTPLTLLRWCFRQPILTRRWCLLIFLFICCNIPHYSQAQTKIWDKTLGGDKDERLNIMIATPDGGYLLGGTSTSNKNGDKSEPNRGTASENGFYSSDYWIVKINATGQKVWDKNYSYLFGVQEIKNLPNGGFVLGGTGSVTSNKTGYTIGKLNASGNTLWNKTYGGNNADHLYTLLLTKDGGYLLGGYSESGKSGDKSTTYVGHWVVKLDGNGEKVWDKSYGGSSQDNYRDMVAAPDGGYLLGGTSIRGKGGDKTEDKRGYWVVKINEKGTKLWEKTFGALTSYFYLTSLVATTDNDLLLGGYSNSDVNGDKSEPNKGEANYDNYDYWIVKVSDTGKKSQIITFNKSPITKTFGDTPFILSAQASSGLPLKFSLVSGPATLENNTLTLTGAGLVIIKASQSGNDTYSAAPVATQTIIADNPSLVTKLWDKTYGGIYNDQLTDLLATPDGGHLIEGISRLNLRLEPGFSIIKINKDGDQEWRKDLGGDSDTRLYKGITTPDGGYLFGGSTHLQSIDDDSYEFLAVRTTSDGTKIWEKRFHGPGTLADLIATPDGGYLLGGSTVDIKGRDKTENPRGKSDYWLVKIDGDGNRVWDKTLGGSQIEELTSLVATPDGGYLVGGSSYSGQEGDKSEKGIISKYNNPTPDYWVVKLNAQGKKLWDKTFGGNERDNLKELIVAAEGGFLLAGDSFSDKSGNKSEPQISNCNDLQFGCSDYWIVRIDENGTKLWDKTLGTSNGENLARLVATSDGGYLLGGSSFANIDNDKSQFKRGGSDYWVLKINRSGEKVWDKTYGGNGYENLSGLVTTADGSFLLGGTSISEVSGDKDAPKLDNHPSQVGDFWLVKIKDESGQTISAWNLRYGGAGSEGFTTIIKTSDGGYLSGGYTNSGVSGDKTQNSQGKNDFWIVKTDALGKKLWDKRYGGSSDDYLNRIIQTSDGGYLLAGSSLSGITGDKSQASRGDRDYWIVKISNTGEKQWDKRYGGSGYDELKKVIQLSTGEYILAGYSNSPASGDKSQGSQGGHDYWLVKVSSTGTKIWDKRYGGNLNEALGGIVLTSDNGFLLGGSSLSGKNGDKSEESRGGSDFWLLRTDKNGDLLWDKTYGGSGQDEAYSVGRAGENEFFISGQSDSPAGADKTRDSQGGKDFWFIKIAGTGAKIWDKRFGGTKDEELRASIQTSDGGYILAGKSYSNKSGNKRQDSQGSSDYWMVKTDADGMYQWSKTFGGNASEELRAVIQTNDGGLLLAGKSDSGISGDRTQPSQGGTDYWLVKIAPETTLIVAVREATKAKEPIVISEKMVLQAYPNPFSNKATIRFTLPKTEFATVNVYDSQGNVVSTLFQGEVQANLKYQVEWQAKNNPIGLYYLQLQTPTSRSQFKMLLIK